MQKVYTDFGFGTFPGTLQYLGAPLGLPTDDYAYAEMTKDDGPLTGAGVPTAYRIDNAGMLNAAGRQRHRSDHIN
jgi:hypothetical protein